MNKILRFIERPFHNRNRNHLYNRNHRSLLDLHQQALRELRKADTIEAGSVVLTVIAFVILWACFIWIVE